MLSSSKKNKIKHRDIFTCNASGAVICIFCLNPNAAGDFSTEEKWEKWKLDYLKWHLGQQIHIESGIKLENQANDELLGFYRRVWKIVG